jgi:hypothetical protein
MPANAVRATLKKSPLFQGLEQTALHFSADLAPILMKG